MDKLLFAFLCSNASDSETMMKCQEVVKMTIREVQLYKSIKEKERKYREYAEDTLGKPTFWILTTAIGTASAKQVYLTGHNVMGIDSVRLKVGDSSEISLSWRF